MNFDDLKGLDATWWVQKSIEKAIALELDIWNEMTPFLSQAGFDYYNVLCFTT